jgi:hypothetical protein
VNPNPARIDTEFGATGSNHGKGKLNCRAAVGDLRGERDFGEEKDSGDDG